MIDDTRGVSVTVTYVLTLGITALLITGLLLSANALFDQQQERSTRVQLNNIGGGVAQQINYLDRLGDGPNRNVSTSVRVGLPGQVAGSPYSVELKREDWNDDGEQESMMYLNDTRADVSVEIAISNETWVETGGVQTDRFEMQLCHGPPTSSEYPRTGPSKGQLIVFGGDCP